MSTIRTPHSLRILQISFLNPSEYLQTHSIVIAMAHSIDTTQLTDGTIETPGTTRTNTIFPYTLYSSFLAMEYNDNLLLNVFLLFVHAHHWLCDAVEIHKIQ